MSTWIFWKTRFRTSENKTEDARRNFSARMLIVEKRKIGKDRIVTKSVRFE